VSEPLGIVAGQGALPAYLAGRVAASGRPVVLAEMEGHPAENPHGLPLIRYRAERIGALFAALREAGVTEVVLAGMVRRPRLDPALFDAAMMALAPRMMAAMAGGDDGLLRAVLDLFETEGFAIRAAHEIAPDLLPAPGVPTRAQPGERDRRDAARAARIVATLSEADVGQGAVVAQGIALAVEAAPGTDAMLDWVAGPAGRARPDPAGAGGVLLKAPKRGQDRRVDLPVIGPGTVEGAARAGLAGIAVEAGGVMVIDRDAVVATADAAGLFLWVRQPVTE